MGPVIDEPTFSNLAAELDRVVDGKVTLAEFHDKFMLEYFADDHEGLPSWNRVFHILAEPGTPEEILDELAEERDAHQFRGTHAAKNGVEIIGNHIEPTLGFISLR